MHGGSLGFSGLFSTSALIPPHKPHTRDLIGTPLTPRGPASKGHHIHESGGGGGEGAQFCPQQESSPSIS